MSSRAIFGSLVASFLAAAVAPAVDIPRPAPDFSIAMNTGAPIPISQYKGKVVAFAFILTTCPHCQKTVAYLSTMQAEYGAHGFQVLASAIDDMGKMLVPDFITRFKPPFPVGFTPLAEAQAFLQHPAMYRMLMPQLVFLDRQGMIRAQFAGDDPFFAADQEKHIREQIESLLKAPPAAAHKKH